MSIRCKLGMHNYRWNVTMTDPQLNWRECTRCEKVHPKHKDQYEAYQKFNDRP